MWQYPGNVVCFMNGSLLGDEKQLCSWAEKQWAFTFFRPRALYEALAQECYTKHLRSTGVSTLRGFQHYQSGPLCVCVSF